MGDFGSVFSHVLQLIGLLFVAWQIRNYTKQRELDSLVKIYDINRQLLTLGFSHPQLFAIFDDAKDADPVWEKHYLQLWFNHLSLTHLYLRRSVFSSELKISLENDLADFMVQANMRRYWQKYRTAYPASFQKLIDGLIKKGEPPEAAHVAPSINQNDG